MIRWRLLLTAPALLSACATSYSEVRLPIDPPPSGPAEVVRVAGVSSPTLGDDGLARQWTGRPSVGAAERCLFANTAPPRPPEVKVRLRCTVNPDERLHSCIVQGVDAQGPQSFDRAGFERAAICTTEYIRMRVTNGAGEIVGGQVNLPLTFRG